VGAATFVLVVFAALVLWLRYVALPDVDRYRPDILASIERASGMAVGVRALRGGWGGLRPVLTMEGVSIRDHAGRAAFQLERAEVTLSWWSLFAARCASTTSTSTARPRAAARRRRPHLPRRQAAQRRGPTATAPSPSGCSRSRARHPRCDAHLARRLRRRARGAPHRRGDRGEKRLGATARRSPRPPREPRGAHRPARRRALDAQGTLARRGEAYAEALNADLARLRNHLPVPETLRSGVGSARLWLSFTPDGVTEATAT
jgi:hypothetical protein